jgi:dihydroorotase-like cyclic amidohydrolase
VKEDAPVLVLEHVRLIGGTGSAPQEDMRIDIAGGKITAVQASSAHSPYPPNAKVLEMTGKTVIPGLVGMHEHLFYPTPQEPEGGVGFYGESKDRPSQRTDRMRFHFRACPAKSLLRMILGRR